MANIKISELNEQENRNDEDLLAIVDVNNNETKKVKVKTLAPQNVEIVLISDTEPTSGINQGEMYYNTTTNKLYTYVGGGVYIDNGEPKFGILYIIYSSQTIYTYNGITLINIGGSGNYSELDGKPSINGNTLNGNKTNTNLGIPNALDEHSDSTEDTYSCDYINNTFGGEIVDGTPFKTGKKYNDKDVYRLVKNLGNLPSGVLSDRAISIGITNFTILTMPKVMYSGITGGQTRYYPSPFIGSSNINTWIGEDGNAYVTTGTDRSSLQITVDLEFVYNDND